MKTLSLMAIVSFLLVISQIKLKKALTDILKSELFSIQCVISLIFSTNFWFAICLTGMAMFIWLYVLSYAKLSVAYPLLGFSYVIMTFMMYWLYREPITVSKLAGNIFIIFGIYLIFKDR